MKIVAALLGLALLGGCSTATVTAAQSARPAPTAPCLPAASSSPAASSLPAPPSNAATRVPDLTLDCFPEGAPVRLTALHRPAILNLWASWCAPCRTELPAFQRYADAVGGRVLVLGVDTMDTRDAGLGFLQDAHVTFPNVYDRDQRLLTGLGRRDLPVTVFVDAAGGIRYVYTGGALDQPGLAALARTHLGIAP